jgi:signal transduction histidine kinase
MRVKNRWLWLFAIARLAATAVGVALLAAHRVTAFDPLLAIVGGLYGVGSTVATLRDVRLQRSPAAWMGDAAIVFALVLAAGEWRSPFYLLALTALILPVTTLRQRWALPYGVAFTVAYLMVSLVTGIDWASLDSSPRLESLATHLMVPLLVTLALSYAADLLLRLRLEGERSARLAVEAERRRIALELHDSAKQRVHASHLVLSAVQNKLEDEAASAGVAQALSELRAAVADLDSSVTDLDTSLEGRRLDQALAARAAELEAAAGVDIDVQGHSAELPTFIAAHAYRVAAEAMTNAVRHAEARRIEVRLGRERRRLSVVVVDDGRGMPAETRPASYGLRSMRARAERLGGHLEIASPADGDGGGTEVRLEVPIGPP